MRLRTTKPGDLAAVAAVALLTLLVALALPWPPLRVPLGLLFVLFAPGYALVAALFPERPRDAPPAGPDQEAGRRGIGWLERVALSLGMSIAVVPLMGLLLNYTPWGIRLVPVLVMVAAFTLGMGALAAWRRARLPEPQRLELRLDVEAPRWRGRASVSGISKTVPHASQRTRSSVSSSSGGSSWASASSGCRRIRPLTRSRPARPSPRRSGRAGRAPS